MAVLAIKGLNNTIIALVLYTHLRLTNGIKVLCITRGFMVGLGNNGFTNPIISSCLEISSTYNPFSPRFPFLAAIHRRNVCRVNGLHNIPPLLPPGDHPCVQNSWHLLERSYLRLFLCYKRLLANDKLFIKASILQ